MTQWRKTLVVVFLALVGASLPRSASGQGKSLWPDFDGDGRTDFVVWRPSSGGWYVLPSGGVCPSQMIPSSGGCYKQWGLNGDLPVAGDFTGVGRNDFAVWRPSNRTFYIAFSYGGTFSMSFANYFSTAVRPAPGDYSGDGRTDIAFLYPRWVNQPLGNLREDWIVRDSSTLLISTIAGTTSSFPATARPMVSADYNGDGKTDRATVVDSPTNNNTITDSWVAYGVGTRSLTELGLWVAGDYTGDGRADFTYWNSSSGVWTTFVSGSSASSTLQWGLPGDIPVTGDFDGDHVTDPTVWRPSNGTFFVKPSTGVCPPSMVPSGPGCSRQWGLQGDIPIPRTSFP